MEQVKEKTMLFRTSWMFLLFTGIYIW